jgi:hypothetical protein
MFVGESHFILEADMIGKPDDFPPMELVGYSRGYDTDFSGVFEFY